MRLGDTDLGISATSNAVGTGQSFDITITEGNGGGGNLEGLTEMVGGSGGGGPYKLEVFVGPNGSSVDASQYFQYQRGGGPWNPLPNNGVNLNGGQVVSVMANSNAPLQIYTFRPVTNSPSSAPYVDVFVG